MSKTAFSEDQIRRYPGTPGKVIHGDALPELKFDIHLLIGGKGRSIEDDRLLAAGDVGLIKVHYHTICLGR